MDAPLGLSFVNCDLEIVDCGLRPIRELARNLRERLDGNSDAWLSKQLTHPRPCLIVASSSSGTICARSSARAPRSAFLSFARRSALVRLTFAIHLSSRDVPLVALWWYLRA